MVNHDGLVLVHKYPPLDNQNIVETVSIHEPGLSRIRARWLGQVEILGHITMQDGIEYYPVAIVYSPDPPAGEPAERPGAPKFVPVPKGRKIIIKGGNVDGERVK